MVSISHDRASAIIGVKNSFMHLLKNKVGNNFGDLPDPSH